MDSVLALVGLRHGVVPGVATLRERDPDLGNLPVSARPQAPRSDVALVLNRGFGGSNTAARLPGCSQQSAVTADGTSSLTRCGIDTVEIARVERLLLGTPHEDLLRIFSKEELCDVGEGAGRTASLAARFAARRLVSSCSRTRHRWG